MADGYSIGRVSSKIVMLRILHGPGVTYHENFYTYRPVCAVCHRWVPVLDCTTPTPVPYGHLCVDFQYRVGNITFDDQADVIICQHNVCNMAHENAIDYIEGLLVRAAEGG